MAAKGAGPQLRLLQDRASLRSECSGVGLRQSQTVPPLARDDIQRATPV